MRFVHVIARLTTDIMVAEVKVTDVGTMMDRILTSGGAWENGEQVMYTMLEELDGCLVGEIHRKAKRVAGYEYRRDFRTS